MTDQFGSGREILSTGEMYTADAWAMKNGTPGVTLMENAGRAVAESVGRHCAGGRVLVLCGPGNNGGDGFVAARLLQERGFDVRLCLLGSREALKGDAAHHAGLWPGKILEALAEDDFQDAEVVVDALFGAGLSRPLDGALPDFIRWSGKHRKKVIAVDVPSGLSGDSGDVLGELAFKAVETVTFFRKKPGHLLLPGRTLCGDVRVVDIGINGACLDEIAVRLWENAPSLWREVLPVRTAECNKYRFGHALVVGGEMTGAGRLAAMAALRIGAGLVTVAAPLKVLPIYAQYSPSLIVTACEGAEDLAALARDDRKNALLVGPGLGVSEQTRALVLAALGTRRGTVIDADGLSAFQESPQELLDALHERAVLTPHDGEFARLFPKLRGSKVERVRQAAAMAGCTVLLKGADTVIARPDGGAVINANAPAWLATAGTGDVLSGIITGLLAQGSNPQGADQGEGELDSFNAACAGTWLHGWAGQLAGPGMIADDLVAALQEVSRAVQTNRLIDY